jgi:acyl-coenzyme A thioesterase PaaI-like protein
MLKNFMRGSTFAKFWLNSYAPYLGAGIRTTELDLDRGIVQVEMGLNALNKNAVGTQFGGSLYAMVDPLYMLLLLHQLGEQHVVWDKAASIDFIKPGRGRVKVRIELDPAEVETIRHLAADNQPVLRNYSIDILAEDGTVVASVDKVLYIRRKKGV